MAEERRNEKANVICRCEEIEIGEIRMWIARGYDTFDAVSYTHLVQAVRETLRQLHIPILGADTGKDHGRTIDLDAATGILTVKTVRLGTLTL